MESASLSEWRKNRLSALDELERAHTSIGGSQRGRRFATQQINRAYAVLLSSEFQGFCRDLHTESVEQIVRNVTPASLVSILKSEFILHRQLDNKNPTPGTIGSDFNRFGLSFWDKVLKQSSRNQRRKKGLEELNDWRNAIAHQDFDSDKLGGRVILPLLWVLQWRRECEQLAIVFDHVMRIYLQGISGKQPW